MTWKKSVKDGATITVWVVIGIIGCPIVVPLICFAAWGRGKGNGHKCGNGARDARRRKWAKDVLEEKGKNRPRSLPPTRRELSIERGERRPRMKFWPSRLRDREKVSSAILRLPAELRRQILLEV